MKIQVVNTARHFYIKLLRGAVEVARAGNCGHFFLLNKKPYLLTGGDYFEPTLRAATLYELKEVETEKLPEVTKEVGDV